MAEDIEIGADTSQAVSAIGNIAKAFEEAARASGASTKAINASLRANERAIGGLVADLAKQSAGTKSVTAAIREETQAQLDLNRARAATAAATGVRPNASGKLINAETGRFASKSEQSAYNSNLQFRISVLEKEIGIEQKLDTIRQRQAEIADRSAARQARWAAREAQDARQLEDSYKRQQKVLTAVFGGGGFVPAADGATRLQRLANVMRQIPPASWAQSLGKASSTLMGMGNSARYALYDVSNSFGIAGAAISAFGILSVGAAGAHERAFANVRRTTQASAAGYEVLRGQLERMSMELPVTFEELTNIATAAGQLGIGASGIASFTSTVAKLSATTSLTSDAAGVALARFKAFFSEVGPGTDKSLAVTEQTFSNLASSILKVGVNSIATETGIVNVATQIASMADYAGFTANQVIGLAGALSSIGVAPELARGTITRTFSLIGQAVTDGGSKLEAFAQLAGVSSEEFSTAWGTDKFAGVFTQMVAGLEGVAEGGGDANQMLQELGFNSVRDRPLLLRLAGAANEAGEAGGLLAQTMADAYQGWIQNSELAIQYNKISKTTSARLQILGQSFEQLAASMGEQTGGFLGEMATQLTGVIKGFEAFSNSGFGQVLGSIAAQGAILVGGLLLLTSAGARTVASIQGVGTAFREMSAAGVTGLGKVAGAFRVLSLSLGIVGIVASVAALVGGFIAMGDASAKASRGLQDIDGLLGAMKKDAEDGAQGITFFADANKSASKEAGDTASQAALMTEALYGVDTSANKGAAGMDNLANASENAKYVFGDTAKAFYRSQLLQSDAFQKLFEFDVNDFDFGNLTDLKVLDQRGLSIEGIDWGALMEESVRKDGNVRALVTKQLSEQLEGMDFPTKFDKQLAESTIDTYAARVATAFGQVGGEVQTSADAMAALGAESEKALPEIIGAGSDAASIMANLDEETRKAVEGMAQGFAKFADMGKLIGLTQTLATKGSDEFEQAWTDAYGGASFSLQQYLDVQGRAATEQRNFIDNLSNLSARGLTSGIISELAAMGPEANRLVQALVDGTDDQLQQFEENFGRTGYDAQVLMATQLELGQATVRNVMAHGGMDALRAFNNQLASGVGVEAALAALQLDINGNPVYVNPITNQPQNLTTAQRLAWERSNGLTIRATVAVPILNGSGLKVGNRYVTPDGNYAAGGYVAGPGTGTSDSIPARLSNGEFVMTAKATRNIGVGNLYRMMRSAQGGRSAPRGSGGGRFANGGLVTTSGAGNAGSINSFGPLAVQQLMAALRPLIALDGKVISDNSASQYAKDSTIGAY